MVLSLFNEETHIHLASQFSEWLRGVPSDRVALVTALVTLIGTFVLNQIVLPIAKTLLGRLKNSLYPYLSGLFIIDRIWSLPRYLRAVEKDVNTLSNPWLSTSQRLTDIYVPVHTAGAVTSKDSIAVSRVELNTLFAIQPLLLLMGPPGCGKTTGMKSIALRCLEGRHIPAFSPPRIRRTPFFIPVFIRLRHVAEKGLTFEEFLVEHFGAREFPKAARLVARLRKHGRLAFLLDGLDEIEEPLLPKAITDLVALLEANRRQDTPCPIVITTRPHIYHGQFSDSVGRPVEIANFDAADIKKFIANFSFPAPKSRERLYAAIQQRPALQQICRNPLMLTIVTSLYAETDYQLPDSREEFYRQCIDALLTKLDSHKNVEKRNHIQAGRKEAFLQEFAYEVLHSGQLEWRDIELVGRIESFLKQRGYVNVDPDRFRFELLMSGLLIHLPTGENQFSHKTFAESLAAAYLHTRPDLLRDNFRAAPATWLEVASLYVADPRTPEERVVQILDVAIQSGDLNSLVILAGESHSCPPALAESISQKLAEDPSAWTNLEDRAIIALCRLGNHGQRLVERMLAHFGPTVRERTVRALGASAEKWTSAVLGKALQDPQNAAFASAALLGMGESAIPILTNLLSREGHSLKLCQNVIDILRKIGGPAALLACIEIASLEDPMLQSYAALACGILLADDTTRDRFETKEVGHFAKLPQPDKALVDWATAWLPGDHSDVHQAYASFISRLSHESFIPECSAADLAKVAPRILIPTLLHCYYHYRSLVAMDPSFAQVWKAISDKNQAMRPYMHLLESDVPNRNLIEQYRLWKDVRFPVRADIQFQGTSVAITFLILWLIGSGLILNQFMFFIPQPVGSSIRTVSDTIVWFNHYTAPTLWLLSIPAGLFSADRQFRGGVFVSSCLVLSILTIVLAAVSVGGVWWLWLFLPFVLVPFKKGNALVFYRRSNPLARLVEALERVRRSDKQSIDEPDPVTRLLPEPKS